MTKSRDLANAATALNAVTAAELGYVDGVTSAIQTQLDAKLASSTAATTYVANALADAKGDIFVASADNTVTRLAVGSTGDTIVADSSTSTGLRYQATYAAGKNAVINGSMTNWQRGTSFTATGYTADRWYLTSPGSNTVSRSTDTPSGFPYSLKWDTSGFTLLSTYVELPAQGVKGQYTGNWTFSFWAKGSTSFNVTFDAAFNNGSNRVDRVDISGDGNIALTTTWTKYSFTLDLTTPTLNANNRAVELLFFSSSGTNSMFLTGVQFEQGSVATGFSLAGGTIQGETSACQRYYVRFGGSSVYEYIGYGLASGTTNIQMGVRLPVTMRVEPTAIDYSTLTFVDQVNAAITPSSISLVSASSGKDTAYVQGAVTGATSLRPYELVTNNSTSGYLGISAEL